MTTRQQPVPPSPFSVATNADPAAAAAAESETPIEHCVASSPISSRHDGRSFLHAPSDELSRRKQRRCAPEGAGEEEAVSGGGGRGGGYRSEYVQNALKAGYNADVVVNNTTAYGAAATAANYNENDSNKDLRIGHNPSTSFATAMEQEQGQKQQQQQQQKQQQYDAEDGIFSTLSIGFSSTMQYLNFDEYNHPSNAGTADPSSVRRKTIVQACYLGLAAILGCFLRVVLAQLFGQACSNPGTIGWIAAEAVLCVTSTGETTQNDGIVFADLPANVLGSFLMGFLQDGASLGLAVNLPVAFAKPSNKFQSYDIFHLALRTGFCGSLTTFSAWNSEMVVLMVGNHDAMPNRHTMVWRALFGYVIGIETAIGSYVFGRTVAWWIHRWLCPDLAREQKAMEIREKKHGIAVNRKLPVAERRYLHGLFESDENNNNNHKINGEVEERRESDDCRSLSPVFTLTEEELAPLRRWRESTREARRVENGVSDALVELETALIVRKKIVSNEHRETANYHGWDIEGLREWLLKRHGHNYDCSSSFTSPTSPLSETRLTVSGVSRTYSEGDTVWYTLPAACLSLLFFHVLLLLLLAHWDGGTAYEITYRTMAYSMLFATPGALLRWKLSGWNGKFGVLLSRLGAFPRLGRWRWLPIGTLAANVLGAAVSISMIGWEYNVLEEAAGGVSAGFWGIATIRAIKIGFSGCLSTVSTFVSEVHKLTQIRQDRGYKYVAITIGTSAVLGMILFLIIV